MSFVCLSVHTYLCQSWIKWYFEEHTVKPVYGRIDIKGRVTPRPEWQKWHAELNSTYLRWHVEEYTAVSPIDVPCMQDFKTAYTEYSMHSWHCP